MRSEDEKGQCTSDASHERCEHCGEGHLAGCPKHQGTKESEKFSPYDPNAIVNRLTPEDEKLLQRTKEACTGCGSTGEKHYYPCPTIEHRPNDAFPDGHAKACPVRLGVGSYCDCPGMSMTPPPCQSSRFPRPCDCCKARILARADAKQRTDSALRGLCDNLEERAEKAESMRDSAIRNLAAIAEALGNQNGDPEVSLGMVRELHSDLERVSVQAVARIKLLKTALHEIVDVSERDMHEEYMVQEIEKIARDALGRKKK